MDIDVEQVIREVFRRLESGPGKDAPTRNGVQLETTKTLQLPGKVITLADVEDRLDGVDTLQTTRGAVITPSARDYLRHQGVSVASAAAPQTNNVHLLLAGVGPLDCGPLSTALAKQGVPHELLSTENTAGGVRNLAARMNPQTIAALLTNQPAAAACLANRHKTIRAAVVRDTNEIKNAATTIGLNLAVIDPSGKGTYGVLQLLREFVTAGLQRPSEEFAAGLN